MPSGVHVHGHFRTTSSGKRVHVRAQVRANPTKKPVRKPAKKPVRKPAKKPVRKPAKKPVRKPAKKSVRKINNNTVKINVKIKN